MNYKKRQTYLYDIMINKCICKYMQVTYLAFIRQFEWIPFNH